MPQEHSSLNRDGLIRVRRLIVWWAALFSTAVVLLSLFVLIASLTSSVFAKVALVIMFATTTTIGIALASSLMVSRRIEIELGVIRPSLAEYFSWWKIVRGRSDIFSTDNQELD
jgi:hypothetical protein